MAGKPVAERPPQGLNAEWLGVWRHALKCLKDQDTWAWEQAPLLAEYVYALRAAAQYREGFEWLDKMMEADWEDFDDVKSLAAIANGFPTQWDRAVKRAAALADQLALTPRGRKAIGLHDGDEGQEDPFADFDGQLTVVQGQGQGS